MNNAVSQDSNQSFGLSPRSVFPLSFRIDPPRSVDFVMKCHCERFLSKTAVNMSPLPAFWLCMASTRPFVNVSTGGLLRARLVLQPTRTLHATLSQILQSSAPEVRSPFFPMSKWNRRVRPEQRYNLTNECAYTLLYGHSAILKKGNCNVELNSALGTKTQRPKIQRKMWSEVNFIERIDELCWTVSKTNHSALREQQILSNQRWASAAL